MSDNDIEHLSVLWDVQRFVATPKTVDEVADEFVWHPQTARRFLWELKEQGRVVVLNRKRGRKQLWHAAQVSESDHSVILGTREGGVELSGLAGWSDTALPVGNLIGGALAYLWRRAFYMVKEDSPIYEAKRGILDPEQDVKAFLSQVHAALAKQFDSLSQILLDLPELFADGDGPLRMMGEVDRIEMENAAHEFEALMVARRNG